MASLVDALPSPEIYPQKYDPVRDAVLLVRMGETDYRAASFLDDRLLSPEMQREWAPFADVARAADMFMEPRPLHFIFHAGHVGSTLLSRLLDAVGSVLGLREPLPLRTLAEAHDVVGRPGAFLGAPQLAARLETFLRLWARGFPDTKTVVLKATSTAGRLAPVLMKANASSQAVYLNVGADTYLATLLAGANALSDLKGFAPERLRRLSALLSGAQVPLLEHLSTGELAALSWLVERLTQARLREAESERVLAMDFEAILADVESSLATVCSHFSVAASPAEIAKAAQGSTLSRYSKAPDQYEYSPEFRSQLLAQARREHAEEIREGHALLARFGKAYKEVAGVMD